MRKSIKISFVSEKLEKEFNKLRFGRTDEKELFIKITKAFEEITELKNCIKIQKKLWPKSYKKFEINNLWKYNLPGGWRIIFTLEQNELFVLAIILEIFNHKQYEKKFKY